MKKFLLLMVLLFGAYTGFSQFKNFDSPRNYRLGWRSGLDKLVINFGNGEKMEMKYPWYILYSDAEIKRKDFWNQFDKMFNDLTSQIGKLNLTDEKYHIVYKTDYLIAENTVAFEDEHRILINKRTEIQDSHEFKMENGILSEKIKWQHILEFCSEKLKWSIKFYVNDLNDLKMINQDYYHFFNDRAANYLAEKGYKKQREYYYTFEDGKIKYLFQQYISKRHPFFALHLYPMVGTSIIKGKLSTDFGLMLGASFNDHKPGNSRLGLRYQLKGFGEETAGGLAMRYNGFVDGTLDVNIGVDANKKQDWLGAGLGYLVNRSGEVYGKNTARLFLNYRSSKLWGIQPEFNYSFNDRKGFIGLGLYLGW